MKSYYINTIIFLSVILFFSCHTTIFHNVEKRLQGTWIRTPIPDTLNPDSVPIWSFENGKMWIDNRIYKGGGDPSTYWPDTVDYTVVSSMTRHLLFTEFIVFHEDYYIVLNSTPLNLQTPEFIDSIKALYSKPLIEKWQFIKMSKSQMYLSKINATAADYITENQDQGSNKGYDLNGGVQIGFIRK